MTELVKIKPIRCPKCRKSDALFTITECWSHAIEFEVTDGMIFREGYMHGGYPTGLFANCSCGRSWNLRGVSQITNLHVE